MTESQRWLITGGVGYIGAHIADQFLASGKDVVLYDDLRQGLESRVQFLRAKHKKDVPLVVADIRDLETLTTTLGTQNLSGVIHSAALKSVSKSIESPEEYFEVNHIATKNLIECVKKTGIANFIFSSTAAVYGSPSQKTPIGEDYEPNPISPYGASKLSAEVEVNEFLLIPGNRGTSLRFFNVVGSAASELMDNSKENLVPIVLDKLKSGQKPVIYGTDYPTPDGTCVRDYVDVRDVALAHLKAANSLTNLPRALNVGTGHGVSVREAIVMINKILRKPNFEVLETERRPGDPATLTAQVTLIEQALGFKAKYSFLESLESLTRNNE